MNTPRLIIAILAASAAFSTHSFAQSADWQSVIWREPQGRNFLADMMLGGSRDFYHRAAEAAHEMSCQAAVACFDAGMEITNFDQFERKKADGKILITRKGSNERISGMLLKFSAD